MREKWKRMEKKKRMVDDEKAEKKKSGIKTKNDNKV